MARSNQRHWCPFFRSSLLDGSCPYLELLRNLPPLTRLTGMAVPFTWREAVEGEAFTLVKRSVQESVYRHSYDPVWPTILKSDASNYAGGCAIKQKTASGEAVILYYSFCFSPIERQYPTFKKELYAIVHFIIKWHRYLGGLHPTTIQTDHRLLLGFQDSAGKGNVEGIYASWAEVLERANVTWEYLLGRKNSGADALSRIVFLDYLIEMGHPEVNEEPGRSPRND